MNNSSDEIWVKNLQLIAKASVSIGLLFISENKLNILMETDSEKLANLRVNYLSFSKQPEERISKGTIEILNWMSPKTLFIQYLERSFDDLKFIFSLSSPHIDIYFKNSLDSVFKLTFLKANVLYFDSGMNQKTSFKVNEIEFSIKNKSFKEIHLIKEDFDTSGWYHFIFIPFEWILQLKINELKISSSFSEFNKEFFHNQNKWNTQSKGFTVPLKYLDKTCINSKNKFFNAFIDNKNIANEIWKARRVEWEFEFFDDLLLFKQLPPGSYNHINYSWDNCDFKTLLRITDIDFVNEIDLAHLKLIEIYVDHILSVDEFKLIWQLLCSNKIKFTLSWIQLSLNSISECLQVLLICAECQELNSIYLEYLQSDLVNEKEELGNAIKHFNKIFGFIESLSIIRTEV